VRADLRKLSLDGRFPLVIAPFNVLMHMYSRAEIDQALAACMRHLAPGGRLGFDVLLPDVRALSQSPDKRYRAGNLVHPRTSVRYVCFESSHYDPWSQIRTMHLMLDPKPGQRATPKLVVPLSHRQLFPAELELLLPRHGFTIEALYGDFDRSPPSATSPSQIIVATR
jgi:hypothetical protein